MSLVTTRRQKLVQHWPLLLILGLYLLLGTAYSLVNPPFEGYDEQAHFRYITWLAAERRLPVLTKGVFGINHETWQPPLYYVMGAASFGWVDTSDLDAVIQYNPYWAYGIGDVGRDNKNAYLHGPWENFPFQKTILALHAIRWLSVLIGAISVISTYFITDTMFQDRPLITLGATALTAFNPQFIYTCASVTNDGLVTALVALTTLVLVRHIRTGWTMRVAVLVGILASLAILTKLSGLIVLPLIVLAILVELRRTRQIRPAIRHSLIVGTIVLLVSGWWFGRNWILYGDWTSVEYMRDTLGRYEAPLSLETIGVAIDNVRRSYWACFGPGSVPIATPIYQALDLIMGLATIGLGLVLYGGRSAIRSKGKIAQWLVILAWVALTVAAVAYYISGTPSAYFGRNLFVAIPALSLLLFLGLQAFFPRRLKSAGAWATLLALVSLAIICLVFYIAPAYAPPPVLAASDMPTISHPLYVRYADCAVLRGYDLDQTEIQPGETLRITLHWQVLRPIEQNYSVFVQVFGQKQQGIGQRDTYPGLGNLPTSQWQPGTVIVDTIPVPISPQAQGPVLARIDVGLYVLETLDRLPTFDEAGNSIGNAIGHVKLPPSAPAELPAQPVYDDFGHQIALVGHTIDKPSTRQDPWRVTLYWQALEQPALDYTVFLHLVDAQGQWAASTDGQPRRGEYPTSWWVPGEQIIDPHLLSLQNVPPGRYELWAGLYDPVTGDRLPVLDDAGQPIGDHMLLTTIEVQR
ncbi:MAG: glycosyltransferase family 39 protein [Chloroflexi bacterium]|nr:glycosyltransferase family 39 protein [Chloroflexota bacterium]MBU1748113.1 glycosyltransferase family 39 protein [Chloroflexota bacterium]MBU1877776.1 glycosyltransferase family 39 protein [Chloroflexota bacterium]